MYYLFSLASYLSLLWVFGLSDLTNHEQVLIPHDTFYPVSDYLNSTVFATFNSGINFGNNLLALMVLTPDAVVIGGLRFFFNNWTTQIIHIFLCLIVFHTTSFLCIKKIFGSSKLAYFLTLCYCLSPYASILYSAGIIYQLTTVIALGLIPLLLFRLMEFEPKKDTVLMIPLMALLGFGLLFIYPTLMLLPLVGFFLWKREYKQGFTNIATCLLRTRYLLLVLLISIPFAFFMYQILAIGNDQAGFLAKSTSSAIQGGIFYPLMQISAWGLYNIWSPRAILSFYPYFFSNPYRILSIALAASLIFFLFKNKKFVPIIFVLFLAFFAKGSNPPFGEFFSFIINYAPFGYMIRSPDSKFGAFIAAWFIIGLAYLPSTHRKIVLAISAVFFLTNLSGMYFHGAISSSRGDPKSTNFVSDPEAPPIAVLVKKQANSIVIGNYPVCAEEYFDNKFHTCHGILANSINRQFIHAPGRSIFEAIKKYEQFPITVIINKHQRNYKGISSDSLIPLGFSVLYSSENYEVLHKNSSNEACVTKYNFSCISQNGKFISSIPSSAFRYYYPDLKFKLVNNLVVSELEPPPIQDPKKDYFIWVYMISYLLCLFWVIRIIFSTPTSTNSSQP